MKAELRKWIRAHAADVATILEYYRTQPNDFGIVLTLARLSGADPTEPFVCVVCGARDIDSYDAAGKPRCEQHATGWREDSA